MLQNNHICHVCGCMLFQFNTPGGSKLLVAVQVVQDRVEVVADSIIITPAEQTPRWHLAAAGPPSRSSTCRPWSACSLTPQSPCLHPLPALATASGHADWTCRACCYCLGKGHAHSLDHKQPADSHSLPTFFFVPLQEQCEPYMVFNP